MSEKEDLSESENRNQPEDIPPPPPIMPAPDIIDPRKQGATYGGGPEDSKRSRKKTKERSHPLDPYEPLKKKKGCGGCCGCFGGLFALVLVLFIGLVAIVGWFGPGRYVKDGYEVVSFKDAQVTVSNAPDKPTCFIGQAIEYNAPSTEVPIAIIGTEITVSGSFGGDLSLSGAKVYGKASTVIAGDLEVYAAEFYDEGIELKGALKGGVMKNIAP